MVAGCLRVTWSTHFRSPAPMRRTRRPTGSRLSARSIVNDDDDGQLTTARRTVVPEVEIPRDRRYGYNVDNPERRLRLWRGRGYSARFDAVVGKIAADFRVRIPTKARQRRSSGRAVMRCCRCPSSELPVQRGREFMEALATVPRWWRASTARETNTKNALAGVLYCTPLSNTQ